MQITLNEDEIKEAIEAAVRKQITIAANQNIEVKLTAGRGENGHTATLEISALRLTASPTDNIHYREASQAESALIVPRIATTEPVDPTALTEITKLPAAAPTKPPSKFRALKPVTQVADTPDVVDPAAGVEDELVSSDPVTVTVDDDLVTTDADAEAIQAVSTVLAEGVDDGLPEAQPEPDPVQVIKPARTSIFNVRAG